MTGQLGNKVLLTFPPSYHILIYSPYSFWIILSYFTFSSFTVLNASKLNCKINWPKIFKAPKDESYWDFSKPNLEWVYCTTNRTKYALMHLKWPFCIVWGLYLLVQYDVVTLLCALQQIFIMLWWFWILYYFFDFFCTYYVVL